MTSTRLAAAVAAVLAVGAVGFAGCGGSDDTSGDSTTAAISKDDFVTQANQICAEGDKTLQTAGKAAFSGGKPSKSDLQQFANDTVVPTIQGEIDGIEALGAPEGDEEQVNAITDAAQSAIDEVKADPSVFVAGDQDVFAEANKLANAYGLTECGG